MIVVLMIKKLNGDRVEDIKEGKRLQFYDKGFCA